MIVVITGAARSGKDTLANTLVEVAGGKSISLITPAKSILARLGLLDGGKTDEVRKALMETQEVIAEHFPDVAATRIVREAVDLGPWNGILAVQMRRPHEIAALRARWPGMMVVVRVEGRGHVGCEADEEGANITADHTLHNVSTLADWKAAGQTLALHLMSQASYTQSMMPTPYCHRYVKGRCEVTNAICADGFCPRLPGLVVVRGVGGLVTSFAHTHLTAKGPAELQELVEGCYPQLVELGHHDTYIGQGTPYGNTWFRGDNRVEAIQAFDQHYKLQAPQLLTWKALGCHCGSKPCHGRSLIRKWAAKIGWLI